MTLAERVSEAINGSGVSVATIAKASGITPQAVYQWMSGDSLEIEGSNLAELADLTGYAPLWIAKEKGPRRTRYAKNEQQATVLNAMESMSPQDADVLAKISNTFVERSQGENPGRWR